MGVLTATGLLVQELVACWARAFKANLKVSADMGTASIVVQTLVQAWGRTRAPEGPGTETGVGAGHGWAWS